jgi:tetratricopeptide (TPR) repeat protein
VAIGLALATMLTAGYSYLLRHLPESVDLLFIALVLFGGGGGVLYAIREGDLVAPRFHRIAADPAAGGPYYAIRLGWVGDALFGFAGAAAIFLLIPGLSESALATMQELRAREWHERNGWESAHRAATLEVEANALRLSADRFELERQEQAKDLRREARTRLKEAEELRSRNPHAAGPTDRGPHDRPATDFLELVAVTVIGGFGGRAVLHRASAQLLHQRVERVQAELDQQTAKVTGELAQTRANSGAQELAAQQLNPLLPPPNPDHLERAMAAATAAGRLRVLDAVERRLRADRGKVAAAAVPLLEALLRAGAEPRHPFLACLGAAHGYLGDRRKAVALLDEAIEAVKDDESAHDQLKTYQVWREEFSSPPARKPQPRPARARKG